MMKIYNRVLTKLTRHYKKSGVNYTQYVVTIPKEIATKFNRNLVIVFLEDRKILLIADSFEHVLEFLNSIKR